MTLSFQRQQAGEYNITDNGKYLGLILKQSSSKWIVYFCSNPATKGNPKHVAKTLKDCKAFCETHFSNSSTEVPEDNTNQTETNTSTNPDVKELMREMLKRGNVLNLNSDEIDVERLDLSDVVDLDDDADFSHFLNQEETLVY